MRTKALLFLFLLNGCESAGPVEIPAPADRVVLKEEATVYEVDLLFAIDGCKVYRFYDDGSYKYFTNCNGSIEWKTESSSTVDINGTPVTTTTVEKHQSFTGKKNAQR